MNDLTERVRTLLSASKTRLDFSDAIQQARDLVGEVHRDGTLLEMQKRSVVAAINTAIEVLQERYDSPVHLHEALWSLKDRLETVKEPEAGLLAQWFFHLAYSGQEVASDTVELVRNIVGRRQSDLNANERELALDLDRYEWLASFGPSPELTRNNAKGVIVATEVRPLSAGASVALCTRAFRVLDIADERSKSTPEELARESLEICRRLITEAVQAHSANSSAFLPQTPSFCVRVSLRSIEEAMRSNPAFAETREDTADDINELRSQLNAVGFRSSSAVFAQFQLRFESFRESMLQSIDFNLLWERLKQLQNSVRSARKGQRGVNQLAAFHANEAWTIVSGLFEDLKRKQGSKEELFQRIRELENQVEQFEELKSGLTTGLIKKLQADLKRDAPLVVWTEQFSEKTVAQDARKRLNEARTRLGVLWERTKMEEPTRASDFAKSCDGLKTAIRQATEPPVFLSEIMELRRAQDEFSPALQRALRSHVDEVFKEFRHRVSNAQLLTDYLNAVRATVDLAHRRIFSPIDFEDLNRRVTIGRRWASLRDFPDPLKASSLRLAKTCMAEIFKLQARQQRMMAERETRSAEIFAELEADVAEGVAEARASPGRQECWDELVTLDRRLRDASRSLNDHQFKKLRTALDDGFQHVRDARSAFAIEAGRRFAYYNDILGDILSSLEEAPTKDSAFGAIDRLKSLRASLREEKALLRAQRTEISGMLNAASQAVEEIFDKASAESKGAALRVSADLDRLERQVGESLDWGSSFALIATHKAQSAAVRDAQLSITDRKEMRLRLERIWEDISENFSSTVSGDPRRMSTQASVGWSNGDGY